MRRVCGLDLCEDGARTLTRESVAAGQDQKSQASSPGGDRAGGAYDFDRLERAVRSLVAQQNRLATENQQLRDELAQRDVEAKQLNAEIEDAKSRREGAIERVDTLMAELDRLDTQLDEAVATPSAGGSS